MSENNSSTSQPSFDSKFRCGIQQLLQARSYSQDASADLWDFAVEIEVLYDSGMTISDLRWLVAKGYVEHGQDTSEYGDAHRSFRIGNGPKFTDKTCFVLTSKGGDFGTELLKNTASAS